METIASSAHLRTFKFSLTGERVAMDKTGRKEGMHQTVQRLPMLCWSLDFIWLALGYAVILLRAVMGSDLLF